ncbi:ompL_phopr porin-like protein L precursor [Photobacterium sp. SKA34]|uniref:porin n=1 Tax=Photobacterium sp. SKA34 TaxID=121723 RepID=UPI00006B4F4F|nr:porin [Photobacterium sp. SKA34]EAR57122.1 ompL_phopr porin-like protein L precursor [Photobacterium sp. SKA34]
MNKHLIALAVTAATLSGAASAAQVYSDDTSSLAVGGRVEARALLSDQADSNGKYSDEVTDQSRARVNIDAKTQIADGVQGIGFLEEEIKSTKSADSQSNETRYVYAGVSSDQYGQIVYGKADGSLGMLTDFTDIMAYHGNLAGNKIAAADRTSNNLAYAGTFGDLTFKANYVFGGAVGVNDQKVDDVHGFSTGAVYNVGDTGLALGAGYGEQKAALGQQDTHKARSEQTFAVASYTVGDLYFGGLYKDGRRDTKNWAGDVTDTTGYEAAVAYTMGKAVFTTTYNYLEDTNAKNGEYKDLQDAVMIDGTYYFNSNFRTYASYKFNMLDDKKQNVTKAKASDEFVIGARYDF